MAFSDYQNTYSWQAAIELAPKLTMLAEELPSAEQNGLGRSLLNLALDLPTAIGIDLQTGSTSRNAVLIKLQSALELTGRIYPALDNGAVQNAVSDRLDRFTGEGFAEAIPAPVALSEEHDEPVALQQAPVMESAIEPSPAAQADAVQAPAMPDLLPHSDQLDTSGTHISLTPQSAPPTTEGPAIVSTNIQQ
jgi:hypothetical protein